MAEQAESQEERTTNDEGAADAAPATDAVASPEVDAAEAPVAQADAAAVSAVPVEAPEPEGQASAEAPAAEAETAASEDGPAGEDFGALLEEEAGRQAEREVQVGDKVSGVLIKINPENSFVDFGGRSEGVIKTSELMGEDGQVQFNEGDPLEAFVRLGPGRAASDPPVGGRGQGRLCPVPGL